MVFFEFCLTLLMIDFFSRAIHTDVTYQRIQAFLQLSAEEWQSFETIRPLLRFNSQQLGVLVQHSDSDELKDAFRAQSSLVRRRPAEMNLPDRLIEIGRLQLPNDFQESALYQVLCGPPPTAPLLSSCSIMPPLSDFAPAPHPSS